MWCVRGKEMNYNSSYLQTDSGRMFAPMMSIVQCYSWILVTSLKWFVVAKWRNVHIIYCPFKLCAVRESGVLCWSNWLIMKSYFAFRHILGAGWNKTWRSLLWFMIYHYWVNRAEQYQQAGTGPTEQTLGKCVFVWTKY